jgi:hypothetical protein
VTAAASVCWRRSGECPSTSEGSQLSSATFLISFVAPKIIFAYFSSMNSYVRASNQGDGNPLHSISITLHNHHRHLLHYPPDQIASIDPLDDTSPSLH